VKIEIAELIDEMNELTWDYITENINKLPLNQKLIISAHLLPQACENLQKITDDMTFDKSNESACRESDQIANFKNKIDDINQMVNIFDKLISPYRELAAKNNNNMI
jgi:hypothetical protein